MMSQTVSSTRPHHEQLQLPARWEAGVAAALAIAAALSFIGMALREPYRPLDAASGGALWPLPLSAWLLVALLAAFAMFFQSNLARLVAVISFGVATIGILGLLEPFGVFHDSWRNVGLGQLAASSEHAGDAQQIAYVASAPASYLFHGILSSPLSDTPGFLRMYPLLSVVLYSAGLYALATAFADAHGAGLRVDRTRYGLLTVFAFLALSSLFWVRMNPAPQSLAFALMPFCLAAVIKAAASAQFRLVALAVFVVIVFTHPITAAMTVAIGGAWMVLDGLIKRRTAASSIITANTVILYICVFLSWMIYIGVWIISTGGSFIQRMLVALDSGQHATVTATLTQELAAFIGLHRVAIVGGALLVAIGLLRIVSASRVAGARLVAWLVAAAAWLPFLALGEFGDRGPLFASLPAALCVGLALSGDDRPRLRGLTMMLMLVTTMTGVATAYSNHIGEAVTAAEVRAFEVIADQSGEQPIRYGYVPPLAGTHRLIYGEDRVRPYAIIAADFSYERLLRSGGVIVISDQMRAAAALRGAQALAALERFEAQLLGDERYDLIFDNGSVRAFRAR